MNEILRKTHTKHNIDILRARDRYFNIAKTLNLVKTVLVIMPPSLLALSYLPFVVKALGFSDFFREVFVGSLTVAVFVLTFVIDFLIDKYAGISDMLREFYDHKVLGVQFNRFVYDDSEIEKYISKDSKTERKEKYETWYSEVFCDNDLCNIFCCQIDNVIYAKHAYGTAKKVYSYVLAALVMSALWVVLSVLFSGNTASAFLIVFSIVECFDVLFSKISKLKEALDICTSFSIRAEQLERDEIDWQIICEMQQATEKNRGLNIFLPRFIRNMYLKDDNPFYRELNHYKHKFMGEAACIPEKSNDIDTVSEDGELIVALSEVQLRLKSMLEKVILVLEREGITYTLDGGTLIGAMRNSTRGFIPWDDDIDIAIPSWQIDEAKKVLSEHLSYVVQDVESEEFYSPRLSPFRIREQNTRSVVCEKDSALFELYQSRGVFIDVYAYSPVLGARWIDAIFRRLFVHPRNKRLERLEKRYYMYKNKEKTIKRFKKLKNRHIKILNFYKKHAKNKKWLVYSPEYIHSNLNAGPYHRYNELYGEEKIARWEGMVCRIPSEADAVLTAYYGRDWRISPFKTKVELLQKDGSDWYSKAATNMTALKHISHINHFAGGEE